MPNSNSVLHWINVGKLIFVLKKGPEVRVRICRPQKSGPQVSSASVRPHLTIRFLFVLDFLLHYQFHYLDFKLLHLFERPIMFCIAHLWHE